MTNDILGSSSPPAVPPIEPMTDPETIRRASSGDLKFRVAGVCELLSALGDYAEEGTPLDPKYAAQAHNYICTLEGIVCAEMDHRAREREREINFTRQPWPWREINIPSPRPYDRHWPNPLLPHPPRRRMGDVQG